MPLPKRPAAKPSGPSGLAPALLEISANEQVQRRLRVSHDVGKKPYPRGLKLPGDESAYAAADDCFDPKRVKKTQADGQGRMKKWVSLSGNHASGIYLGHQERAGAFESGSHSLAEKGYCNFQRIHLRLVVMHIACQ